jgi:hypothetical protein
MKPDETPIERRPLVKRTVVIKLVGLLLFVGILAACDRSASAPTHESTPSTVAPGPAAPSPTIKAANPQAAQSPADGFSPAAVNTTTLTPLSTPGSLSSATQVAASTAVPTGPAASLTAAPHALLPAASPAPMPDLAFAAITADDLPSGFQVDHAGSYSYGGLQSYVVANDFLADRPGYAQELSSVVIWLPSLEERTRFDRSLAEGAWLADLVGADAEQIAERYEKLDVPRIGEITAGMTSRVGEDPSWNTIRGDAIIWRRGNVGALVLLSYLRGDEDLPPIEDIARRLDERIAWVLSADPTSRSGITPTPAPRLAPAPRPARTPIDWSAALTPTLTLADLPTGFEVASEKLGTSELTISADSPYPAVSTFFYQRFVYVWVFGFVVNLLDAEAQAGFDAAISHPDALVEELCGLDLPGSADTEPSYTDLLDLGDAARQATLTDPASFLGPVTHDLVCLRRAGLGACIVVQSLYPKREPHVRDLARLLDDRMRMYETTRP